MKTTLSIPLFLLATVIACNGPKADGDAEPSLAGAAALGRSAAVPPRFTALARLAKDAALLETSQSSTARSKQKLGGLVQIFDDQLTNTHGMTQVLFFDDYFPVGCYRTFPIDGGECWEGVRCDPAEPDFMGRLVDVGTISLSSSFDTIVRGPAIFHDAESFSGPFWRGDGDSVSFAYTGNTTAGVAPFEHVVRAPVGDAAAVVPKSIARTAPLRLTWRYANGKEPARNQMVIGLVQTEPQLAALACRVPMNKRGLEVPSALLGRFSPGAGVVAMTSTTSEAVADQVVSGSAKLILSIQSTVDIGNPDPNDANVVFE